ncbi:zinc finger C2H2 domain-containing protein [Vairimorpha necatrix]|uniref:Zinc finger C2H2 domain-containing protein n=1 Tax=Vairimorpha necatrix TaxID=6039 RepID=A0AAX4JDU0_9MICR
MKRNLNHENIDIFFLLNENKILTKSELQKLLPMENYAEYIKGFYRRRFIDLFNRNYDFPWFSQKYLLNKNVLKTWNFDFKNSYFLINDLDLEEDPSKLASIVGYVSHYPVYNNGFKLDIILELNEVRDIVDEIQSLFYNSRASVTLIKKDDLTVKERENEDQDILSLVSAFYKVEVNKNNLRDVFLYCANCNTQYYSDVEMIIKCGKSCSQDSRRKELLKNYTDFSYMKNIHVDFILKSNIIKYEENVYKCAYCEKKFESEEFIKIHYNKKHSDEIELREKKYEEFKNFVDNIDLRLINLAEGSLEGKPWFAKIGEDNKIVYDMNHVFSGEIILNEK